MQEAEVVGRMADERDVVGELRLGRVEERRRKQARKGDQRDPLPDPAERRGARTARRSPSRVAAVTRKANTPMSQITSEKTTWMTSPL